MRKPSVLFVTDLYYPAKGRNYYEEDIFLTSKLRHQFDVALCHPTQTEPFERSADIIMIRNSGPVLYYAETFRAFVSRMEEQSKPTYNALSGKADIRGKLYLVELTERGFPVIPTIDDIKHLDRLPVVPQVVIKPINGADSVGMKTASVSDLSKEKLDGCLIQPVVDMKYEVSFYFIDDTFQYALYAPDRNRRWELKSYEPTVEDLRFAKSFIDWNALSHGIQRVDACRTKDDELLLVELEDLNPYLSLAVLVEQKRELFITNLLASLKRLL